MARIQEFAGTFVLGEVAGDDTRVEYDGSYQEVMDGVLNFPTYYSLKRVFTEGFPMTYLKENLEEQRKFFKDLKLTGTFIDNHDTMRFLNTANMDVASLKNSLAFIFFGDGIPIIYAGTEHGFIGGEEFDSNRESTWPPFQERSEIFDFIKKSLALRKSVLNAVVGGEMTDCYVDENYYILKKQIGNDTIIFGITKAESDGEEYKVTIDTLGQTGPETFENLYNGQTYQTEKGHLNVVFIIFINNLLKECNIFRILKLNLSPSHAPN